MTIAMPETLSHDLIEAVRAVVGTEPVIGLHEPEIGDAEKLFVSECLDSTFVSSVGPFVTRFEEEIAAFTGAGHAVAVSNGTSALQVALFIAGVRPGEEVLIPSLSFIATANAVSHCGAVPHFVDSDSETMGMDPEALGTVLASMSGGPAGVFNPATGRRIAAIMPMHTLGHPADIEAIVELADAHSIPVVEDAAESLGSFVGARHTGTFGRLGVLSFNGNKIVTTGGGGMILTDDPELARHAKHLTTTAKLPHAWEFEHDEIAWNFRMPNLNAAMGVGQLTKLDRYLADKREIAAHYSRVLEAVDGVTFVKEPAGTSSNFWLCAVRLDKPDLPARDELLSALNEQGLRCRPFWNLASDQRMYVDCPKGDLRVARSLLESTICLPSSPRLAHAPGRTP